MDFFFSDFLPIKVITIDKTDPPWMMDTIKSKIQWQNSVLKNYQMSTKTTKIMKYYNKQ